MTMKRTTTKLFIPHTDEKDCLIAGVLERHESELTTPLPEASTTRKIAIILHGTMGHKDYLFQKKLAHRLPLDSFRFDFRGNHETPGTWKMGALAEDVVDLTVVVEYLTSKLGYEIDLIVGHSRGSVVGFYWLSTCKDAKSVRGFVNISGRYRMKKIFEKQQKFNDEGYHVMEAVVARKPFRAKVYPEDYDNFANWDSSIVDTGFPHHTHILTIHGMLDQTVPTYDSLIYASTLSGRNPGTFNLHLSEEADHNFTGPKLQEEVVGAILQWWDTLQQGALKDGLWLPGIRKGKL